jgi:predicted ATPase/signal transduction histidine kinase/tRNA A-37 threonylcarbamoyl transferase component Bud32
MRHIAAHIISQPIYESAQSIIYRAVRASDGAPAVIKVLNEEYPSPTRLARFSREFEMARKAAGDGIIEVSSLERHGNSALMVLEDFGGEPLERLAAGGALGVVEALGVAVQAAAAVERIHAVGLIHKDINPSNVLYNPRTGVVKVIDFGISTDLSREELAAETLGGIEGTLAYIAPEQTGRMNRGTDHRADIYSLGATLYFLATGQPPFPTTDPLELLHCHLARQPAPPHQLDAAIPASLSAIVQRAMAKAPEDRYQSAAGLRADLERCREALKAGSSEPFELGRDDARDLFLIPEKLYGREREIEALFAAFERASAGRGELVLVPGYSGVGKSSLIEEVHKPLVARRGRFISGKFDQYRRDIPYSALVQALELLVRQILGEGDDEVAATRRRLLAALGPNVSVVLGVIPDVGLLVGEQPPAPELSPAASRRRFELVLPRFVGALASEGRPLVLVLDDLQWADSASLRALELILSDDAIGHALVIGAYRDNEVDASHPLAVTLATLDRTGARISSIALRPLGPEHVADFVADTLRAPRAAALPLASLCLAKTGGNPFFLCRFLETLHAHGLIRFHNASRTFRWSVKEIERVGITDNLVELMAERIRRLPEVSRRILERAACLGNTFDLATLALVWGQAPTRTAADLRPALEASVVVPTSAGYRFVADESASSVGYRFSHDRVQQAAASLMSPAERAATHLAIGRLLSSRLPREERRERLFEIVNHLNLGRELLVAEAERDELARYNLEAGVKAAAAAAYGPAFRYHEAGLSLLGEHGWARRYDLALALTTRAADAAYLVGDLEAMERLVAEAHHRARTTLDRVPAYETWIAACSGSGKLRETIPIAREILRPLGVELPLHATKAHAAAAVVRIKLLLVGRSIASMAEVAPMTDPHERAALRVLIAMASAAYTTAPDLFPVVIMEAFRLTVTHGSTPESPFVYSAVATICIGLFADIEAGEALGRLSLRLAERPESQRILPRITWTFWAFVGPWIQHLGETTAPFIDVYRHALEVGDVEFAGLSTSIRALYMLYAGVPLAEVECEATALLSAIRPLGAERATLQLDIIRSIGRALAGTTGDLRFIGGEAEEAVLLGRARETEDSFTEGAMQIHKLWLCYLAGDHAAARAALEAAEELVEATMGVATHALFYVYGALTELATIHEASGRGRLRAHYRVLTARRKLATWARHAPMNYAHWVELIDAERARASGDGARARERYDRALVLAREHGRVDAEALAAELAGRFYLGIGSARLAEIHLRDAHHAYLRWGAAAKAKDLEARYPTLLERRPAAPIAAIDAARTGSSGADAFDFLAVARSAQAISSEVVLDDLLRTLMRVLLESAGAERGLLLVEGPPRLAVEADPAAGGISVRREEVAAPERTDVSAAILRYVRRTGERVVLADAMADGAYEADPRVIGRLVRSVLCMPIVQQQRTVGVLYLENNLARGAFTPARCQVLEILAGQAAISISNAMLYETLERRVEERTAELSGALERLKETQLELVQQEKLAALGMLTSGVAHAIENPLNFINNFAESGVEITREALAEFARLKGSLDPDAAAYLEEVLRELEVGSAKIHAHGQRADQIVRSMMAHAHGPLVGTVREVALNPLVQHYVKLACEAQRQSADALDVPLTWDLDEGAAALSAVPEEIGRVLLNLMANALDAVRAKQRSAPGTFAPAITVSTRSAGDHVEIRVRDNGAGIPTAIRDKVFVPFFTTKVASEGTGLGLSLSHEIVVRGHGGAIGFESEAGQFTEFCVSLPRRSARAPDARR